MIKSLFFTLIVLSQCLSMDYLTWQLPVCPSGLGDIDCRFRQNLVIASRDYYDQMLNKVGCDNLDFPAPNYTQLEVLEAVGVLSSKGIILVKQGEAKILRNPKSGQYLATHSLMDCVGVSIFTPEAIYFTHMDLHNLDQGKFGRLLDRVPQEKRKDAPVTLVTSFKSVVLSGIFLELKSKGFGSVSLDVEEGVIDFHPGYSNKIYSAEMFSVDLKTIKGRDLSYVEQHTLPTAETIRSLIVETISGNPIAFFERQLRGKEHTTLFMYENGLEK